MARERPTTLELSDRDYRRLRRALRKLDGAEGRRARDAAEDALEDLAEELKIPDAVVDELVAGNVQLEDDDDGQDDDDRGRRSSSRRRRDDDDDRDDDRGRRSSSRRRRDDDDDGDDAGATSSRRVRVVERDDDDEDDDDGGRRAQSLKDLKDRPGARPARRKKDAEPARTPETTHWFHRALGANRDSAAGAS